MIDQKQTFFNVREIVKEKLNSLFDDYKEQFEIDFIAFHGSIVHHNPSEKFPSTSDIDILVKCNFLTQNNLQQIYQRLASISLLERKTLIEKRIGPIAADRSIKSQDSPLVFHVTVHDGDSFDKLSPAIRRILDFGADAIIGTVTAEPDFSAVQPALLELELRRDMGRLRNMIGNKSVFYWVWSDDDLPRQIFKSLAVNESRQMIKLVKHARAIVQSWASIAAELPVDSLDQITSEKLLELAGALLEKDPVQLDIGIFDRLLPPNHKA